MVDFLSHPSLVPSFSLSLSLSIQNRNNSRILMAYILTDFIPHLTVFIQSFRISNMPAIWSGVPVKLIPHQKGEPAEEEDKNSAARIHPQLWHFPNFPPGPEFPHSGGIPMPPIRWIGQERSVVRFSRDSSSYRVISRSVSSASGRNRVSRV